MGSKAVPARLCCWGLHLCLVMSTTTLVTVTKSAPLTTYPMSTSIVFSCRVQGEGTVKLQRYRFAGPLLPACLHPWHKNTHILHPAVAGSVDAQGIVSLDAVQMRWVYVCTKKRDEFVGQVPSEPGRKHVPRAACSHPT